MAQWKGCLCGWKGSQVHGGNVGIYIMKPRSWPRPFEGDMAEWNGGSEGVIQRILFHYAVNWKGRRHFRGHAVHTAEARCS